MASGSAKTGPRVLGLTGPIACGKSTVGDILLELGVLQRIDADHVVHDLLAPGTEVNRQIREVFGSEVMDAEGGVDRSRLGAIVFRDPAALAQLESITHPAVRVEIRRQLAELRERDGVVVVDAVKLLQSDLLPLCNAVWVVTCDPAEQRRRLRENRSMSREAADGRLLAQPPFDHPAVTTVIENSGSQVELQKRVAAAWSALTRNWQLAQHAEAG
jgi:dephospho-CoA kinase